MAVIPQAVKHFQEDAHDLSARPDASQPLGLHRLYLRFHCLPAATLQHGHSSVPGTCSPLDGMALHACQQEARLVHREHGGRAGAAVHGSAGSLQCLA